MDVESVKTSEGSYPDMPMFILSKGRNPLIGQVVSDLWSFRIRIKAISS